MGESEKLVFSVAEAAEALRIGRTLVFQLIRTGELGSIKIGHRRLITRADLEDFVASMRGEAA